MSVSSLSFPYGESITWHAPDDIGLPGAALTDWLLDGGSLTARLKTQCQRFEVKVLGESELIDTASAEPMWVREVLLVLDGTPWVFARTLVPPSLLARLGNELTGLGERPLGELLFASDHFRPGRIEVASFDSCSALASLAESLGQNVPDRLWGRRRYFGCAGQELTVSEIFLPAAVTQITS
ncbi:chorismate lyase [Shewanella sp. JM162201]|uniref:Probable chorismate pyruvate-lyase n=1 Tax=Shewanella jiangmenensis TaxID=2837387 RepID=A0ABS5V3M2_9GAMM|nr:chorismate lyase [Shewanella jiangmenensis]MBT1445047.1 chorismate lyase [Shewanella jiangmenensis]